MRAARRRQARRRRVLAVVATLVAVAVVVGLWALAGGPAEAEQSPAPSALRKTAAATPKPAAARQRVAAQATGPATITVSAVGDMIFDRRVKALISRQGGAAPLEKVASRLRRADVTVGNLESNLSSRGSPQPGKDVTFRGHPRGIEGIKASGFDLVALGNNHVLDYGPTSLKDTLAALDRAGVGHAGAGMNRTAAWRPAVITRDGATVAFLSFSQILPAGFTATGSKAGLARGRGNMDAVAAAIKAAQTRYDYVIVSFHWGIEYKDYANGDQVRDARRAIDAGANMVLSHHPHVIQGVEFYKRGLIAYSLGDFVFDHYSRKTGEAFILDAKLGPAGVTNVVATPVYLNGDGAPAVVTGSDATVILKRLRQISAPHGSRAVIANSVGRILP
jgi:poly-gamma-glutamate capsule biosynthesis protein CapA/YwtB (metallophosphatase superfamily)